MLKENEMPYTYKTTPVAAWYGEVLDRVTPLPERATATQVAAAMIAVVAEHDPGYVSSSCALYERGNMCIQGAVMQKLGVRFEEHTRYGGNTSDVMLGLGYTDERGDFEGQRLHRALHTAQMVNDAGLPWALALELFELVLTERMSRNEAMGHIQQIQHNINEMKTAASRRAAGYRPFPNDPVDIWGTDGVAAAWQALMAKQAEAAKVAEIKKMWVDQPVISFPAFDLAGAEL